MGTACKLIEISASTPEPNQITILKNELGKSKIKSIREVTKEVQRLWVGERDKVEAQRINSEYLLKRMVR